MSKFAFLDRDGVINFDHGYVYDISNFVFLPGIFDFCRSLINLDYSIAIVTNQSGIARGYYTIDQYQSLTSWMLGKFSENNVQITTIKFCPYHEQGVVPEYTQQSYDRKPYPGMIMKCFQEYNINVYNSFIIGDKLTDLLAGKAANLSRGILFDPQSKFSLTDISRITDKQFNIGLVRSFNDAISFLSSSTLHM